MATQTARSKLHFPNQDAIISYLQKDPRTCEDNNPFLTEKKIIQVIAQLFAKQDKTLTQVQNDVMAIMQNLNEKLKLSEGEIVGINTCLTLTLKDCAN
jgi:hypothetical protein